jgi:uncharacterized protein
VEHPAGRAGRAAEAAVRARAVAWLIEDPDGAEHVAVRLRRGRLGAVGVAIGSAPRPYRLDYRLETGPAYVTTSLRVDACGDGWRRRVELRRARDGAWSVESRAQGDPPLGPPGGDAAALGQARDCDLGLSPLTNAMPVLRAGLLEGGPAVELAVAWVSVPDLGVRLARQRYAFVRALPGGMALVRFETADGSFSADLTFDRDGLVVDYPGLARRLGRPVS